MAKNSPTQRAMRILEGHGATRVAVVEKWNPHSRTRHDLFGVADLVALGPWGTLAVQATSSPNVAARVAKLLAEPATQDLLVAGWRVEAWGLRATPDRYGQTLVARSLLLEEDGTVRVSQCSETLAVVCGVVT